jgi:hypothetical protein
MGQLASLHGLYPTQFSGKLVFAFPVEQRSRAQFSASVRVSTVWAPVKETSASSTTRPYTAAILPGAPGSAKATGEVRYHESWHPMEYVEECQCNGAAEADASVGL